MFSIKKLKSCHAFMVTRDRSMEFWLIDISKDVVTSELEWENPLSKLYREAMTLEAERSILSSGESWSFAGPFKRDQNE